MATKVTSQHGFDLAAMREVELHPEQKPAWERRRDGLKALHAAVNALVDEVSALREELAKRPF
jgi:hypothetical protein